MRRLVWGLLGLTVMALAVAVVVGSGGEDDVGILLVVVLFVASMAATGSLLALRLPHHPVGWLLLASALGYAIGGLAVSYVDAAVSGRYGALPLSAPIVWLGDVSFGLGLGVSATYLLLYFPTGSLPSPKWKPVPWMAAVSLLALLGGVILKRDLFSGLPIQNPIGLDDSHVLLVILEGGGFYLLMSTVLLSAASLVARYRRARGVERQQLKWVVFSVVLVGVALTLPIGWELATPGVEAVSGDVENFIITGALALVPLAIGVAILRFRLYEIDRIVSRTVSYGLVTGLLVGVYVAVVVGLGALVRSLGGEGDSSVTIAAATLVVAALFRPARRRTQAVIDRRFNRARYDAAQAVAEFGSSLKAEVALDEISLDLTRVVVATIDPARVTLWLRTGGSA